MAEKLLAIIPARGGSKRLPGKNIRPLGGKPLIAWSIASAVNSALFRDVLVSTDDAEIARVAKAEGALVPWLRPPELATDSAGTLEVLHHALTWYEQTQGPVDAIVLLQPTSPFRRQASLSGAVEAYLSQPGPDRKPVISVSRLEAPLEWCFHISGDVLNPVSGWDAICGRSQEAEPAFRLNGSIYVVPAQTIRNGLPLLSPGVRAYVMEAPEESIDIDVEEDWQLAEAFLKIVNEA